MTPVNPAPAGPSASFADLLARTAPEALPRAAASGLGSEGAPHGTTIVCATYAGGVAMATKRSLSEAARAAASAASSVGSAARRAVPLIGRVSTWRPRTASSRSGDDEAIRTSPWSRKAANGAGLVARNAR